MCRAGYEIHIVKTALSLAYLLVSKLTANHHAFDTLIFMWRNKDVYLENTGKRDQYLLRELIIIGLCSGLHTVLSAILKER